MGKQSGVLKVALVGIYPPPYGGVSIHVQRLHEQCLASNIRCTVFDVSRRVKKAKNVLNLTRIWNWPRILASRQDIIHVHTTSMHWVIPAFFYYLARIKGAKFVLSYHSLRYSPQDFSALGRRMMKIVLSSAAYCIAINSEIYDKLLSLGARPERTSIIPSFLPPVKKDEEVAEIPRDIWDFIDRHKPVISASAFRLVLFKDVDRYGVDMCVDLCASLRSAYPEIGVVFCLPDVGDYKYFRELKRRIATRGIENNFLFQTRPCQFYPVLMKSDIFVRPTNADSYGISVAEAIYFKVPAIASDVCQRPEGTVLFKNRDVEDFIARVKMVWDNYGYYRSKMESLEVASGLDDILKIYRNIAR